MHHHHFKAIKLNWYKLYKKANENLSATLFFLENRFHLWSNVFASIYRRGRFNQGHKILGLWSLWNTFFLHLAPFKNVFVSTRNMSSKFATLIEGLPTDLTLIGFGFCCGLSDVWAKLMSEVGVDLSVCCKDLLAECGSDVDGSLADVCYLGEYVFFDGEGVEHAI